MITLNEERAVAKVVGDISYLPGSADGSGSGVQVGAEIVESQ